MKRFLALILAALMLLTLVACGGGNDIPTGDDGDKPSGEKNDDKGGLLSGGGYKGDYVFDPPTDNYHIVYGDVEEARVGDRYVYFENVTDGYSFSVNYAEKTVRVPYQGKWYNDTNLSYEDYGDESYYPLIFREMEDGLIALLRAFGTEDDELGEKLKDYYIGDETVCGVKCHVFDSKGINANYTKYWVDPSNGAVIKLEHYNTGGESYVEELTVYDINYTEMEQRFYPAPGEEIGII